MKNKITVPILVFILRLITLVGVVAATTAAFSLIHSLFWLEESISEGMFRFSKVFDFAQPFVIVVIIYQMGMWTIKSLHNTEAKKDE